MNKITPKGEATLQKMREYILNYILKNMYSPSVTEIKNGCNITSTSTVRLNLSRLEIEGFLELGSGNRTIKLVGYKVIKQTEE